MPTPAGGQESKGLTPISIGFRLIREGDERHVSLGMYGGCTEMLCAAVEALLIAGDLAVAAATG